MEIVGTAWACDVGRVKARNEDAVLGVADVPLFAVADGSGGVEPAETCLAVLRAQAEELRRHGVRLSGQIDSSSRLEVGRFFDTVFNEASRAVRERALELGGKSMAATAVAATLLGDFVYVTHVGNSRAYLYRDGKLRCLTIDHTLAMLQVRRGKLSPKEYARSPHRKTLTQALGVSPHVSPDLAEIRGASGDRFLLCSDGLHNAISDRSIAKTLAEIAEPQGQAAALVDAANRAGGKDNVSVVLFALDDGASPPSEVLDVARSLDGVFLFRDLSEAERLLIAPYFELQRFAAGEHLCREGEPGDSFFVMVRGRATVTHGRARLVELGPGQYAGEIALAREGPRTATITARTTTETLTLTRRRFLELVRRRPGLGVRLLAPLLDNVGGRIVDLRTRFRAITDVLSGSGAEDYDM